MKPLGVKNYGSIGHLSNSKLGSGDHHINEGQEKILTIKKRDRHDTIYVYEKYDGSNVGIAKVNGKILALTRSGYEAKTSAYKQHHVFSDWVSKNENKFNDLLNEGERIVGEWMIQAHGMRYIVPKENPIIFFDIFTPHNTRKIQPELIHLTYLHDLHTARLLHFGGSVKVSDVMIKLNWKTENFKSEGDPEGMVYRVERHGKVDFLAKWVRENYPTGQYLDKEISNIIK
jgi:ATP-dependent RNA circularization protein (DNA/RNA ligase family)